MTRRTIVCVSTIPLPNEARNTASSARRSTFTIHVEKEYHKFSAAHFLIFDDGSAERLHGHNYRCAVDLSSATASNGLVLDFKLLKPLISKIIDQLDERFIVPGCNPALTIDESFSGETEIRFGRRRYVVPSDEVCVLPIENSSSENLAEWIADALTNSIQTHFPSVSVRQLAVSIEETPGQRGIFTIDF